MSPVSAGDGRRQGFIAIGVLSDTHGHLYARVKKALEGVDHIIHAGDVGSSEVLAELRAIAPVTAVRGNCDLGAWAQTLPTEAELELDGVSILIGHVAGRLRERLTSVSSPSGRPAFRVVITGHSHRVECEERDGVLHLNPGSAGPERFGHPRTLARLFIAQLPEGAKRDPGGAARVEVELALIPGD